MANRAKHAFGSSSGIEAALQSGKIDSFDILFLDGDTNSPKIGWIDRNGKPVIVTDEKADLSELEAEVANLETEISKKLELYEESLNSNKRIMVVDDDAKELSKIVNILENEEKIVMCVDGGSHGLRRMWTECGACPGKSDGGIYRLHRKNCDDSEKYHKDCDQRSPFPGVYLAIGRRSACGGK